MMNGTNSVFLSALLLAAMFSPSGIPASARESPKPLPAKLENAAKLQETARLANGGALGCGGGSIVVETRNGAVRLRCGLDPIHVFGGTVSLDGMLELLKARIESYKTGQGPMSGQRSDLCFVILTVLGALAEAESVDVVTGLLIDPSETVRDWALIALIRMGTKDPKLRDPITRAVQNHLRPMSPSTRGEDIPLWLWNAFRAPTRIDVDREGQISVAGQPKTLDEIAEWLAKMPVNERPKYMLVALEDAPDAVGNRLVRTLRAAKIDATSPPKPPEPEK